jgi:pimeloyl-ACP methyl ester carboxylesterase
MSADGTTIGYVRGGSGPSLVITHGSLQRSEHWIPVIEQLADHFTCFAHDRRGRGRSGDAETYDLDTEVADIAAMMEVAGPDAHLLGHSYGALCALAYAERRGHEGFLIAFEPPLAVDGPVAGEHLSRYRELIAAGDCDGAIEHALVHFVRVPPEAIPMLRQTPLWAVCVELAPTWVRELEQIDALGDDLTHYASIESPVRLIAGGATTPVLLQSARTLADMVPQASLIELDGGDHFANLSDPAGLAKTIVESFRT